MATGKCLKCDKIAEMTEEHIVPDWFFKRLGAFVIKNPPKANEVTLVCKECNIEKGGNIDFSHMMSRELVKEIINIWIPEIRKHDQFNP